MKRATEFILKIKPNTKLVDVIKVELENTRLHHCFQNSALMFEQDEDRYTIISGWLVGDWFGLNGTAVIPHYWIYEKNTKQYIDPTPIDAKDTQSYDYVIDFDIFRYGNATSYIPASLRLLDNKVLQARVDANRYEEIKSIDVKYLYEVSRNLKEKKN